MGTLSPNVYVIKSLNSTDPDMDYWGIPNVTDLHLDMELLTFFGCGYPANPLHIEYFIHQICISPI